MNHLHRLSSISEVMYEGRSKWKASVRPVSMRGSVTVRLGRTNPHKPLESPFNTPFVVAGRGDGLGIRVQHQLARAYADKFLAS